MRSNVCEKGYLKSRKRGVMYVRKGISFSTILDVLTALVFFIFHFFYTTQFNLSLELLIRQ